MSSELGGVLGLTIEAVGASAGAGILQNMGGSVAQSGAKGLQSYARISFPTRGSLMGARLVFKEVKKLGRSSKKRKRR